MKYALKRVSKNSHEQLQPKTYRKPSTLKFYSCKEKRHTHNNSNANDGDGDDSSSSRRNDEKSNIEKRREQKNTCSEYGTYRTMWCEREMGIIYGGNLSETERSECLCINMRQMSSLYSIHLCFTFLCFPIFHWSIIVMLFFVLLSSTLLT